MKIGNYNILDIKNKILNYLKIIFIRSFFVTFSASVLAIDPPPRGINDVCIKYSILPILPLNGMSPTACGKMYLCNLGIPEKFYCDAGIKYKSPFGHKFVIPLHLKD